MHNPVGFWFAMMCSKKFSWVLIRVGNNLYFGFKFAQLLNNSNFLLRTRRLCQFHSASFANFPHNHRTTTIQCQMSPSDSSHHVILWTWQLRTISFCALGNYVQSHLCTLGNYAQWYSVHWATTHNVILCTGKLRTMSSFARGNYAQCHS
jgi:hypothetical protein